MSVRNVCAGGVMAGFQVANVPGTAVEFVLKVRQGPLAVESRALWMAVVRPRGQHGLVFPDAKPGKFLLDFFVREKG